MNDAALKRWMMARTYLWAKRLRLDEWTLQVQFHEKKKGEEPDADMVVDGDCEPSYGHRAACIRYFLGALRGKSAEQREVVIVHELVHCKVNHLLPDETSDEQELLLEAATTDLTADVMRGWKR